MKRNPYMDRLPPDDLDPRLTVDPQLIRWWLRQTDELARESVRLKHIVGKTPHIIVDLRPRADRGDDDDL